MYCTVTALSTTGDSEYLVVTFTNNLTWSEHVCITQQVPRSHLHKQPNMVQACLYNSWKGNRVFGFLQMNLKVRAVIYTTMLKPILEYAACTWDRNYRRTFTNLNKPNVGLLDSHSKSTLTEHPVSWEPCCETSAEKD